MISYGPERERGNLLDIERREQYVNSVFMRAALLSLAVPGTDTCTDQQYIQVASIVPVPVEVQRIDDVEEKMDSMLISADLTGNVPSGTERCSKISLPRGSAAAAAVVTTSAPAAAAAVRAADTVMDDLNYLLRDVEVEVEVEDQGSGQQVLFLDSSLLESKGKEISLYEDQITAVDTGGCNTLTVVFDGDNRAYCDFKVKLSSRNHDDYSPDRPEGKSLGTFDDIMTNRGIPITDNCNMIHLGGKRQKAPKDEMWTSWVEENLISATNNRQQIMNVKEEGDIDEITDSDSADCYATIEINDVAMIDENEIVYLGDKSVCPKIEDDVICRMIYVDQLSYKAIITAAGDRMRTILKSGLRERVDEKARKREEWASIESLYLKQRNWRKVASTIMRGMKDHTADFNKTVLENVPASWVIRVDGRPKVDLEAEEEDKDGQEDAVCMVCFDGSSLEGNKIMFCDGCNAAVHQACYGVTEIPEGDFFCDRCKAIQVLADEDDDRQGHSEAYFDPDNARDAIKCCMCPLYHGGLKPTTDGRWIHLCCAIWSGDATILDLSEMSPIDVSCVSGQKYIEGTDEEDNERKNGGKRRGTAQGYHYGQKLNDPPSSSSSSNLSSREEEEEEADSEINESCIFCGAFGGYVVQCSGCDDNHSSSTSKRCSAVFHPLCAWFNGLHVRTRVTDPTFQGQNRGGLYPSGISFEFLCDDHCPISVRGTEMEGQMILRQKYKINEEDLDQIPGKNRKRKKKRVAPGVREVTSTGRSAGAGPKVKELSRDTYDGSICALCLAPMEPIFPHSRDKPVQPISRIVAAATALRTLQDITAANNMKNFLSITASADLPVNCVPFVENNNGSLVTDVPGQIDPSAVVVSEESAATLHQTVATVVIPDDEVESTLANGATGTVAAAAASHLTVDLSMSMLPVNLGSTDIPSTHSYYHRLVCVDCGINVHLGCHCETGGASILNSSVMGGTAICNHY